MNIKDPRTHAILGAAFEVHSTLGRGFLEAVYHVALIIEFTTRGISFAHEVELPVFYKGRRLDAYYRADFVCFGSVIVEVKAIKELTDIEKAQILNYLKATNLEVGLLLNFGSKSLEKQRFANYR